MGKRCCVLSGFVAKKQFSFEIDDEIDFDVLLIKLVPFSEVISIAAKENKLISPNNERALGKVSRGEISLTRTEKNAMKNLDMDVY